LLIAVVAVGAAVVLAAKGGPVPLVAEAIVAGLAAAALWQLWLNWVARSDRAAEFGRVAADYALPSAAGGVGVAHLLRPEEEVAPFWPRPELDDLTGWIASSGDSLAEQSAVIRLVVGAGGSGKTRLARELAKRAAEMGFRIWWVGAGGELAAARAAGDSGQPSLLIVDYAENRTSLDELLAAVVRSGSSPLLRVLLLARRAGEWWEQLIAGSAYHVSEVLAVVRPVTVGPVTDSSGQRQVFGQAVAAFAVVLHVDAPVVELPLSDPQAVILVVHAAALRAVLDHARGGPQQTLPSSRAAVLASLLRHEARYWRQSQAARGLNLDAVMTRRVVTAACLIGAEDEDSALGLLAAISDLGGPDIRGKAARWLHDLYPAPTGEAGEPEWLGSVQPDLVAEHLITEVLSEQPGLIPALFAGRTGRRVLRGLTILARAALTEPAAYDQLAVALARDLDNLAVPALAVAVETNPAVGNLIASAIGSAAPDPELLTRVAAALPDRSLALAETAATVFRQLADLATASGLQRAGWLSRLGNQLMGLGRHQEALAVIEEAIGAYRKLIGDRSEERLRDLARSLSNLSNSLSALGRRDQALTAIDEAVVLYRELLRIGQNSYLTELAGSLTNQSRCLSAAGRRAEALAASEEALRVYRQLTQAQPGLHLPGLALTLSNHATRLSELSRPEEALAASSEALRIRRQLADTRPDAYLPDLARSLSNQVVFLSGLARQRDALAAAEEALRIRRGLAETQPEAYLPDVAMTLNNMSEILLELGRPQDALSATREAVDIDRQLAEVQPDAYLSQLAGSLNNMSNCLSRLGDGAEALSASREALRIRRRLAETQPDAFLPDLAMTLSNQSSLLSDLGRPDEALTASSQAVGIYQMLTQNQPAAFQAELAASLSSHSSHLSALGSQEDGIAASEEAVNLYRQLAQAQPDAFRSKLTKAQADLADILDAAGQHVKAQALRNGINPP
jgi:hypothetical protein